MTKKKQPLRLEYVDASELAENPDNWRTHSDAQLGAIKGAIDQVGWAGALLYNERTKRLIDGHARKKISTGEVPVLIGSWTEAEEKIILATFDPIAAMAGANAEALAKLMADVGTKSEALEAMLGELAAENGIEPEPEEPVDAEPQIDRAAELQKEWGTKAGDLWVIEGKAGEHRVLCGDSTKREDVERVMGGEKSMLVHADPPYGMGKEKDGVENDNLYREKLDAFQMAWWRAARPSVADNGSAYIWGNAEALWRLWYCGGLKDSERMTLRNEIVWDKGDGGQNVGTEGARMFFPGSERCLLFMLGEQGFNNNADNYWEGWDSVVDYLRSEKKKTGWDIAKFKRLAGHSETSGCHWFDKSQWMFPTAEVYRSWQKEAKGKAFKREHDDLKREFYATRAYFDNTHDNMTDVWDFPRVTGEERHGHPTPKPVAMISRVIKTSSQAGDVVLDPFLGSGTTLIAAENLNRRCFGIEISAAYTAVILQRAKDCGMIPRREAP